MEYFGTIALIVVCWLFADNLLIKGTIKKMRDKIKELEKSLGNE